jgi:hypothetical protein
MKELIGYRRINFEDNDAVNASAPKWHLPAARSTHPQPKSG